MTSNVVNTENGLKQSDESTGTPVIKVGKKQYSLGKNFYGNVTPLLLNVLKDQLLSKLVGMLNSPMAKLSSTLGSPVSGLLGALEQLNSKKG